MKQVVAVMSCAVGFTRLIRPVNCLMMGVAVVVGAALTGALASLDMFVSQLQNLLFGFSTGFLLTGATMAINDYYDREIDAINEPTRPIPSGVLTANEALMFAFALSAIGFAAALFTGWKCFLVASAALGIFVLYTTKGKRMGLAGNLLVSLCVAVPFVYGGFVVDKGFMQTISVFAGIVFLSNTGREITKGIVDVQGDRENNIRTVAVVYGRRKAAIAAAFFYLSAVSLTPLPWLLNTVSLWFLPFVALTDAGLVYASISLVKDHSRANARRTKKRNLLWFSIGLLAFVAGTLG